MQRFLATCVFATFLLTAGPGLAQSTLTGSAPAPAASINYETTHLEKRLTALRATGDIMLDGALDEAAWSDAPIASGFIQNDPKEGTAATFDTEVRVLYTDDARYFGVWARDDEPSTSGQD